VNADEIMHVLRLTAMGRLNTPAQEEFCEKLAKVMAEPLLPTADVYVSNYGAPTTEEVAKAVEHLASLPKRTRKTKAE
jgi:hypothetical protein